MTVSPAIGVAEDLASRAGVCLRPLLREVLDREWTSPALATPLRLDPRRRVPKLLVACSALAEAAVRRGLASR
jgi:hypothetical protein